MSAGAGRSVGLCSIWSDTGDLLLVELVSDSHNVFSFNLHDLRRECQRGVLAIGRQDVCDGPKVCTCDIRSRVHSYMLCCSRFYMQSVTLHSRIFDLKSYSVLIR